MGDIFEDITNALPAYERFVVVLQARAAAHGSSYPRLAKALALVYVDILRFCHSAYLVFSNRKRGMTSLLTSPNPHPFWSFLTSNRYQAKAQFHRSSPVATIRCTVSGLVVETYTA